MANTEMTIVFSYDISRPRSRRRVAEMLQAKAVRVQKSVFEARMSDGAARRLFKRLAIELDDGDSLRMYGVSATGLNRSRTQGGAPILREGGYWLL
jgi:CRISPR-associated protein Cas2